MLFEMRDIKNCHENMVRSRKFTDTIITLVFFSVQLFISVGASGHESRNPWIIMTYGIPLSVYKNGHFIVNYIWM